MKLSIYFSNDLVSMLIPDLFTKYNIRPRGIIHIGAHLCEERDLYKTTGHVRDDQILWIEGNPEIVDTVRKNLDSDVYIIQGLVSDCEREVQFMVTNNGQSSSFLPLEMHRVYHPYVYEVKKIALRTTTLPALLELHKKDVSGYDFLAMDIQGAEYHALLGMQGYLHNFDHIYLEVNDEELYKGGGLFQEVRAFLEERGFELIEKVMTDWKWGDAYFRRT